MRCHHFLLFFWWQIYTINFWHLLGMFVWLGVYPIEIFLEVIDDTDNIRWAFIFYLQISIINSIFWGILSPSWMIFHLREDSGEGYDSCCTFFILKKCIICCFSILGISGDVERSLALIEIIVIYNNCSVSILIIN